MVTSQRHDTMAFTSKGPRCLDTIHGKTKSMNIALQALFIILVVPKKWPVEDVI